MYNFLLIRMKIFLLSHQKRRVKREKEEIYVIQILLTVINFVLSGCFILFYTTKTKIKND